MEQNSRHWYTDILQQPMRDAHFYAAVALILDGDPYFMPGYLEMLWNAEKHQNRAAYLSILRHALSSVTRIVTDKATREVAEERWTRLEADALIEMLAHARNEKELAIRERLLATMHSVTARDLAAAKTATGLKASRFLKRIEIVNVLADLKKEVEGLAPYWWHIQTERQETIAYHQNTQTILLRALVERNVEYQPHDGVHESTATIAAKRLPRVHETVLDFAERYRLGLGKVATVLLKPHCQTYRHFDSEQYLIGRQRYHLVLQAGDDNLLSSGNETVSAKPGEIWFFDNKVMHRAHNHSAVPRIHIIFDGYPLDSQTQS